MTNFSDATLTTELESPFPGPRRVAAALLTVPEEVRSTIVTAAHIFTNTSPGWRYSSSVGHFTRLYTSGHGTAAAQRVIDAERARMARERELRKTVPGAVVFHTGEVGVPNPETLMIEDQS